MPLTPVQLSTLATDIDADGVLGALPHNSDSAETVVLAYNTVASPDYWVWRIDVTEDELLNSLGPDGTTFNFQGNGFITRAAGEHATWARMFGIRGRINPSLAHVRAAIADILSGAGNAAANRTHCLAVARAKATRCQQLFATGTGSTASPATMTFPGPLTSADVMAAWVE